MFNASVISSNSGFKMSYWINTDNASNIEFTIGPLTLEQEMREINGFKSSKAVIDGFAIL